jgi:hypothetical protein
MVVIQVVVVQVQMVIMPAVAVVQVLLVEMLSRILNQPVKAAAAALVLRILLMQGQLLHQQFQVLSKVPLAPQVYMPVVVVVLQTKLQPQAMVVAQAVLAVVVEVIHHSILSMVEVRTV